MGREFQKIPITSVKMSDDEVPVENRVETALINDLDPEVISAVAARSRKNVIISLSNS